MVRIKESFILETLKFVSLEFDLFDLAFLL